MQGILQGIKTKLSGNEGQARIYGLGLIASQMANGQAANAAPALQMLQDRRAQNQLKQQMSAGGDFMDKFSPQEQAFLATLPPQAAQQLIAQRIFQQPTPVAGTEINGQLVNPITGAVMGDFRSPDTGPEPTSDMREYEFARSQGFTGSFAEWQSAKPGGVSVNIGADGTDYGDPGEGLVWQRTESGDIALDERGAPVAIPFQGGSVYRSEEEAAAEAEAAQIAAEAKNALESRAGNVVIEDIGRLEEIVKNAPWYSPATGMGSGFFEGIRGTNAANAAAMATTIKGNIGFDRLQQMRDASPTGGALGQVSQQELETLQSVLGSLSQSQSEDQLLENLERLEVIYTDIMNKAAAYPNAAEFGFDAVEAAEMPAGVPPMPQGMQGITADNWPAIWGQMSEEDRKLFQ